MKQQMVCPMAAVLQQFAIRAAPWVLDEVCAFAVGEGRLLQAMVKSAWPV